MRANIQLSWNFVLMLNKILCLVMYNFKMMYLSVRDGTRKLTIKCLYYTL